MKISVIIPVYNEFDSINSILSGIVDCEIIISDCNGATNEAIERQDVIKLLSEQGRAKQMNCGATEATGDILLFLHADTKLPNDWQKIVINTMNYADAGAFSLAIDSKRPIFRVIEKISTLRSRITKVPYGDMAIFMKKQVFYNVGGYADVPIFEDVSLMRTLKKGGYVIEIAPEKATTSARRWEKDGIIYTTLRNWLITILYLCGVSLKKLKKLYR